jgi:alkanesulfonate monooxygenase SsuD/methylene tetrahydromethanopterin reductase-like flavin-dependent oxidoreductase (luciferase family)
MKIAISCVITEQTAGPAVVARIAEAMGFEGLFLPEHPVIPVVHRTRYPDPTSDGEIPEFYSHMPDPFVLLAMAAQATTHFKIATAICLVPERNPILLAKEVATLDHFSNGRLVFGIGAGWLADETEIMGGKLRQAMGHDAGVRQSDERALDQAASHVPRRIRPLSRRKELSQADAKAPSPDPYWLQRFIRRLRTGA